MNFIFIYLYSHDRMTGVEFIIEQRKFHYYIICLRRVRNVGIYWIW